MGKNLKTTLIMILVSAFGLVGLAVLAKINSEPADAATSSSPQLVRANSHRLSTAADGKVTFVEFIDFECESCKSTSEAVDQLRKEYDGRVTFVVKYFPMSGHFNSDRAARAVEAAAQQGKFEPMYQRMFADQLAWGEKQTPADDTFRGFATDLKLDLAAYDKAYDSAVTRQRISQDVADGKAFGVTGTPTFFLNGKLFEPTSYEDITSSLDAALAS